MQHVSNNNTPHVHKISDSVHWIVTICLSVCLSVCLSNRTEDALGELLREIERHSSSVRFEAMANILAVHCQSEGELVQ